MKDFFESEENAEAVLDLVKRGVSTVEIAANFGLTVGTVRARTKEILNLDEALAGYVEVENKDLAIMKISAIRNITPDKLKEASVRDLVSMFKTFDDRKRLNEGKPTEIKGALIAHIEAVDKAKNGNARLETEKNAREAVEVVDAVYEEDEEYFEEEELFDE